MQMKSNIELDAGRETFATGLLPQLIAALRRSRPGDLLAVISRQPSSGADREAWCRFPRNALMGSSVEAGRTRWIIRCGEAPAEPEVDRPVGSRLWLYTNFDCNLQCGYCCVRSSPRALRRGRGLPRVQRIAEKKARLRAEENFGSRREPFLFSAICANLTPLPAPRPPTRCPHRCLFS